MTRRTQWIAGIGIVIALVVVVIMVRRTRSKSAGAAPDSMAGMAGMQGMSPDGAVRLTASQLTTFGVTFGTVEQRTLSTDVRTVGTVMVDESRMASVTPKINGFVERLYVNTTGQPVRRGQPLADVYSPDLLAAQEELLLARRLDRTVGQSAVPGVPSSSGELLAAARRRLRLWDVSDAQIDEVLRTGRARRTVTLYAPVSGIVTEKKVVVGQAVQAGMELYALADLTEVWVDVQVRETEAANVRAGTGADVEFATYPGRTYKGRVTFIYPTIAEQTRSVRARVSVANAGGQLKPGMYATVRLSSPTRSALTVPRAAVVQTGERAVVFVDQGKGELRPVDVETGASAGEYVEILAGLEPGQRVVTSAQFLLDSESNLAEVMKSMIGMGGGRTNAGGDMAGMDMSGGDRKGTELKGMDVKGADTRGMPGAAGARTVPKAPR
ncbi:MAG: efflux RND transporter periplasmic adaptor subunit [Gemmatimonadaceae bacterium]|nr:efflux RND transporter periplasmic adaptor subunit [Gemmatimonadaceae bacterium]